MYGTSATKQTKWFSGIATRREPRLRLFCLPFAGGNASFFAKWGERLGSDIEVWPLQLPGRETRMREPFETDLNVLVNEISAAIVAESDSCDYSIFGHSMGARLAVEVTRVIAARQSKLPTRLVLSAQSGPGSVSHESEIQSDNLLIDKIRSLGGLPEEILRDDDLMQIVMPAIKADISLLNPKSRFAIGVLPVPITVFGGMNDHAVPIDDLRRWSVHSRRPLDVCLFEGGHFYMLEHEEEFFAVLRNALQPQARCEVENTEGVEK